MESFLTAVNDGETEAPWRLRYWTIFGGQALSLIGSALTQFVLLWWITDTTGSVSALGMAGLFALLPHALLGPLGGTFADRYSRRLIMIVADLVSAACMAVLIALFLTDNVALWHLYTMMAIRSAMQAFQQPAAMASIARLVPGHFLTRAAGLNQALYGIMTIGAAPLGALAISAMPIGWALSIDVVTALLGIVALLCFAIPQHSAADIPRAGLWLEFREGVDIVWHDPALKRMYALLSAAIVVIMPSFALVPLLVKEHFGGGAAEVALIESLSGLGLVAGGGLIAVIAPRRRMPYVLWGMAIGCFSVAGAGLPSSDMFWLAVASWSIGSATWVMGNAPFTAILQSSVPNHLQGRVMSLLTTLMGLGAPVGLAVATPLGEMIGVRWLFVVLGLVGGIVMMLGFLSPAIRGLDDRDRAAAPAAGQAGR
jgi:MFS transporter, DHA3 family, macrolide efflux protein